MDTALNLWPVCFIGLWAYPFIAIPFFRRRRFLMELAQIGHGEKIETLGQALAVLRAFQARLRAEIEAEAVAPTQAEGER